MAEAKKINIYQRMLNATAEINTVAKNLAVGVGKSQYKAVGEADVLAAVKPIEIKHGIYSYPFSRKIIKDDVFVTKNDYGEKNSFFVRVETVYRFVNTDNPEEFVDITTYGDGVDSMDKSPGKAMTYGDKYALLKAYKIQTGDDPDQNASYDLKNKPKTKPTQEQLDEAKALNMNLENVAKYFKCSVEDLGSEELGEAIARQKKALEKQAAKKDTNPEPPPPAEETTNG